MRRTTRRRVFPLAGLLLLAAPAPTASAQPHVHQEDPRAPREAYRIDARRVEKAPDIDGVLGETEWAGAALVDTFTQQEPVDGEPATERTEVRLLYDAEHLYIAVRAVDSEPAGVIATEMRRDSDRILDEDNFQIILDTFRDSRSGYMFVTNPLGAKLEQQIFEEGSGDSRGRGTSSNINRNWDGVWVANARRTDEGWAAEIAIPMVTVRSPAVAVQEWGVNFMRNIRRKNEQVYWAPIPKPYGLTQVSLAGSVGGMTGLNRGLDLRIKPYVIGGGRSDSLGSVSQSRALRDVGLDVKYGLKSGLALDLTVNTDFAQAEVDEQQVNLTRFPLFFPEKRDFFLENSGQFTISTQGGFERHMDLFFSRRIGLSDNGQEIPIIGGARMTGKIAGGHNVAVLDLQTNEVVGRPGENSFVGRYSKDVSTRSKVGGLVINKESAGSPAFNRVVAGDVLYAPTQSFSVHSFFAQSASPGVTEGQQAYHVRALFLNTKWNTSAEFTDIEDHFNDEVGFVPRRGIRTSKVHIERNPRPGGVIRVMEPMVNVTYTTDQNNRLLTRRIHNMVGTRFQNGAYVNVWYNNLFDQLDEPFRIQPGVIIPPGTYRFHEWMFMANTNQARRVYGRVSYSPQTFYEGTRTDTSASVGLRATSQLAAELSMLRNDVDLPWGAFAVNLATFRLDYAITPRMTLRSLSQYNSSVHQLSTSVRFNFVYRPGSDLYVVYDDALGRMPNRPEVRNKQLILKMTYLLSR